MFLSSTSFLPSTFSMYGVMLTFGTWFGGHPKVAVFAGAFTVILGWPFVALMFVPIGLELLFRFGIPQVLGCGIVSLIYVVVPSILIDHYFYHQWVFAVGNIIRYNVFDSSRGPTLYGVEPWTFYFVNSFLNFNFIFVLAL